MTSVNGYKIIKCPKCYGEVSTPNYSSYNVKISGPLLSHIRCNHCNSSFEQGQNDLTRKLSQKPRPPLDHGGFDILGESFEEIMHDLKRQAAVFQANNDFDLHTPNLAIFVETPKDG